jgi:hypothetical protein
MILRSLAIIFSTLGTLSLFIPGKGDALVEIETPKFSVMERQREIESEFVRRLMMSFNADPLFDPRCKQLVAAYGLSVFQESVIQGYYVNKTVSERRAKNGEAYLHAECPIGGLLYTNHFTRQTVRPPARHRV